MKVVLKLWLILFAVSLAGEARAQSDTKLVRISVQSVDAWDLTIYDDGSGSISCGANPNNTGKFSTGTFDIEKVRHELAVKSIPEGRLDEKYLAITSESKGGDLETRYTADKHQVYEWAAYALHHLTTNKERMLEISVRAAMFR